MTAIAMAREARRRAAAPVPNRTAKRVPQGIAQPSPLDIIIMYLTAAFLGLAIVVQL